MSTSGTPFPGRVDALYVLAAISAGAAVAAAAMAGAAVSAKRNARASLCAAFFAFELCVGLYFPMMGTLKGDIVPEDMRSTIYNIYRLPLNVIVLMPLLMNFSISTTFTVTTAILAVSRSRGTRRERAAKGRGMVHGAGRAEYRAGQAAQRSGSRP